MKLWIVLVLLIGGIGAVACEPTPNTNRTVVEVRRIKFSDTSRWDFNLLIDSVGAQCDTRRDIKVGDIYRCNWKVPYVAE